MKIFLLLICTVALASAQAPFNATNVKLTTPPVQGTAGVVDRVFALASTGVGETLTPTVLWSSIVLTGTVDTSDISGFSALGRSLVDDVLVGDMQTTLGATTIGKSYFSLTNPSAITFPRQNANNTVTSRTATEFKTDLSLENVTNTSDANKPVSTAQQTALNLKANLAGVNTFTGTQTVQGSVEVGGWLDFTDTSTSHVIDSSGAFELGFRTNGSQKLVIQGDGDVGINTVNPTEKLEVTGNVKVTGAISSVATTPATLGAAATTFAVTGNLAIVTGDGGGNTVTTITGGVSGMVLILLFTDPNITIMDTDAATANTVDLSAAWTSTARDTLTLVFDGTKWLETSRSVN